MLWKLTFSFLIEIEIGVPLQRDFMVSNSVGNEGWTNVQNKPNVIQARSTAALSFWGFNGWCFR